MLIPGTNGEIAVRVGKALGIEPSFIQIESLPYGEKYIRIPFKISSRVFVLNTFFPNPDEILFESRVIGDLLREKGAEEIVLIAPYLAYSRRGTSGIHGEARALESAMKILDVYDRIIAVDFYGRSDKVESVSAMRLLAEYVREKFDLQDVVVFGPDEISEKWIGIFSEVLDAETAVIKKIRVDAENVVVSRINADVKERDVVIADDIIATGATVVQSAKKLRSMGARRIIVTATHALFGKENFGEILKSGIEDIIATDTVLSPVSRVSVASLLSERIKSI